MLFKDFLDVCYPFEKIVIEVHDNNIEPVAIDNKTEADCIAFRDNDMYALVREMQVEGIVYDNNCCKITLCCCDYLYIWARKIEELNIAGTLKYYTREHNSQVVKEIDFKDLANNVTRLPERIKTLCATYLRYDKQTNRHCIVFCH